MAAELPAQGRLDAATFTSSPIQLFSAEADSMSGVVQAIPVCSRDTGG